LVCGKQLVAWMHRQNGCPSLADSRRLGPVRCAVYLKLALAPAPICQIYNEVEVEKEDEREQEKTRKAGMLGRVGRRP
jgi:hypothetical protein